MHYDAPRTPAGKQWTDQSLYSTRSVDNYLAESDAFQRASFANIIKNWKQYDANKATRLITSFDSHYNMKKRFLQDDQLNRPSQVTYGHVAPYYRFLGSENNPKNIKPCARYKRLTQDYDERHVRALLKTPPPPLTTKTHRRTHFLPKITKLPSTGPANHSSSTATLSVSVTERSRHTFV